MKILYVVLITLILASCAGYKSRPAFNPTNFDYRYDYTVDLNDRSNHTFKVELKLDSLKSEDNTFCFPATIPGTYSVMDVGRFVKSFTAYDYSGDEIPVSHISTNQWQFSEPTNVHSVKYTISDTWDTPVDSNEVARMEGTSIEDDCVMLGSHAVFGYIKTLEDKPFRIQLLYPADWQVGTSIDKRFQNYFYINNYQDLTDSPILLGHLTKDQFNVSGINVDIYTYSKTGKITSDDLEDMVKDAVSADVKFMDRRPVIYYTFLFHFQDQSVGALEHPHCSFYVFREEDQDRLERILPRVIAHEFYHLETPLWIRGKTINSFDFQHPTPSEFLWFYEGTTEWAALSALMRDGKMKISQYLSNFSQKLDRMEDFDQNLSLSELSLNCYNKNEEYTNIYSKGALTAAILDIYIMDATKGKKGLREVINSLAKKYSPAVPFSEDTFYDDFVQASDPAVRSFIDRYIRGDERFPVRYYFRKVGADYHDIYTDQNGRSGLEFEMTKAKNNDKVVIKYVFQGADSSLFHVSDTLLSINDTSITIHNIHNIFDMLKVGSNEIGLSFTAVVKRGADKITIHSKTTALKFRHVFTPLDRSEIDQSEYKYFRKWFKMD